MRASTLVSVLVLPAGLVVDLDLGLAGRIDLLGGVFVSVDGVSPCAASAGLSVYSGIGTKTSRRGVPCGGIRLVKGRKSRSLASALLATGISIMAELKFETQIISPESAR